MPLEAGTSVGPYEIRGLLGAGGMGEVYLAWDPRLGREVALKRMTGPGASDADARARFMVEARAVAALKHPGIVAVHDILWEGSAPYLVMERLEGETLRERLRRGPLGESEARELWLQAVRAVAEAHRQGLIHRDLKPENLFLTSTGALKILDFGLAKRLDGAGVTATHPLQTEEGVLMGTLAYLSPEQARGEPATRRSDVHALGLILLEMLTGRAAFHKASVAETLAAILAKDPLEGTALPAWASTILRTALAKDPAKRPASAEDLDHPGLEETRPPSPRLHGRAGLALAVALAAAAMAGGGWWASHRPASPPASTPATSPGWAALQRAEYMSDRVDWSRHTATTPDTDPVVRAYQEALTADPELLEARLGLAQYLVEWVFNREGEHSAIAPVAYEQIQRVLEGHPDEPRALVLRGRLAFTHDAGYRMEEALADVARACRLDPRNEASRFILGSLCEHTGLLEEAIGIYTTSRRTGRGANAPEFRLARVKWMAMDLEGARAIYLTLSPDQQWELPAVLERMGRSEEARALVRSVGQLAPAGSNTLSPDLLAVQAFLLARQGRKAEAREAARRSEESGRGRSHFHHSAYHLACAYAALGDELESLRLLRIVSEQGMPCFPLFEKDPALDPLRSSPTFGVFLESQRARREEFRKRYRAS